MENNNWKARVGQKVVSLVGSDAGLIHKGEIKTVLDVSKCKCGRHVIRVNVINPFDRLNCENCNSYLGSQGEDIWWDTSIFAPINPYSNSVSLELAAEAIKERVETDCPVREIVNN